MVEKETDGDFNFTLLDTCCFQIFNSLMILHLNCQIGW